MTLELVFNEYPDLCDSLVLTCTFGIERSNSKALKPFAVMGAGEVLLENVDLRLEAFDSLQLPLSIQQGMWLVHVNYVSYLYMSVREIRFI